jgi:hypothetical protein
VDFAQLKSELQLHEKNDLTLMKSENDRLMADVEKLKQRLREEVTRTQAGVRLDLNLEKGRIRDESGQQELKIKEVDTRIESEIAGLRTQIEQAKFSILQYLVGVATGSGALLVSRDVSKMCGMSGADGFVAAGVYAYDGELSWRSAMSIANDVHRDSSLAWY